MLLGARDWGLDCGFFNYTNTDEIEGSLLIIAKMSCLVKVLLLFFSSENIIVAMGFLSDMSQ